MPKFAIIVPTYSNVEGLRKCLESIVQFTSLEDTECIVVANGAPPETREILEFYRYYPIRLIWLPEACGYTRATNAGILAVSDDCEYIVLMNDDVVLLPQYQDAWKRQLLEPFDDPEMAITGPVKHFCEAAQREFLIFFLVMIRREAIDSVGILDEIFSPGSGEDTDWCIRAVDLGWKMQQVPPEPGHLVPKDSCPDLPEWKKLKMWSNHFPAYHDGNATFSKIPEVYEPAMQKNHAILKERYGVKELNTWRAKTIDGWFGEDEIDWLAAQVARLPQGAKVAEIGSWHGRSSRAIADNLPEGGQSWHIDTWIGSSGEPEMHGSANYDRGDHAHQWWWCNLQEHINAGKVIPVRMHSDNAAHTIGHLIEKGQMEKFDLIFIDGDHSEEGIKTDVEAWLPLLKEGGLLCGHDYYKENEGPYWVHVRQYVEQRFPQVEKAATSIWWVRPHEIVKKTIKRQLNSRLRHADNAKTRLCEHCGGESFTFVYCGTCMACGLVPEYARVFDCFLFHNELDILEIRLATLCDVVDYFVIAEGTLTHAGQPKPLHFELNKERFAPYLDKIRHIVVDDWPAPTGNVFEDAWARERHQRDAVMSGLYDAEPNDIVIIGDADEIAHPDVVTSYKVSEGLVRLKQRMFYYYLNCENKEGWDWQKIAPYRLVKELTPCGIRYPPAGETPLVENGGWHFSFCGTVSHITQKIQDYSHQEYNTPEVIGGIEDAVRSGRDIFGRNLQYEFIEIDDSYPQYVKDNIISLSNKRLLHSLRQPEKIVPDLSKKHWTVTASVSTKDRYQTTLPMCLAAIINQTRKPDKLILYDDSEQRILAEQLVTTSPYEGLFKLATDKGIDWSIQSTPRLGQVTNHQHCLDTATTDFIWRVDDDEVPEPNCLEVLLNTIRDHERGGSFDKVGAVGGLVHHPGAVSDLPQGIDGSLNDIAMGWNLSWFKWNGGPRQVDHLYSTFLFNVNAAREAGGYPKGLSKIGHREESIFSHSIKRAGYDVLCTPWTVTHHLRESAGGIRSNPDPAMWEHDEHEWQRLLKTWNVVQPDTKIVLCDFGLGDHLILRGIWPELKRKFPDRKWVMALCFPETFKDEPDITIISIADAKLLLGDRYADYSVYKYAWDNNFERPMPEVMMEFYSK